MTQWPSKEEYYATIQNASYKVFDESHKHFKKYIDLSVGFYGGCSYHPTAWEETFASLRRNFPSAPLIIFEDGRPCDVDYSDMAKRYNATYIKEDKSIYLFWPKPEQAWTYLQWILKAADIAKTEWLVQLHPDNICNDRFTTYPPGPLCGVSAGSKTGISCNQYPEKATQHLRKIHPDLELNGYGWCGGGCIHVPTFREIMKTFTYDKLLDIVNNIDNRVVLHEDLFLPFLFNLYGYPYRVWLEIEEPLRGFDGCGSSAAFQHGNKSFYKVDPDTLIRKIQVEVNQDLGTNFFYGAADMK